MSHTGAGSALLLALSTAGQLQSIAAVLVLQARTPGLLDSQSGPFTARVFIVRPTASELALESALFRVLLLWLRFPLPHVAACCRCRRPLDGTHGVPMASGIDRIGDACY